MIIDDMKKFNVDPSGLCVLVVDEDGNHSRPHHAKRTATFRKTASMANKDFDKMVNVLGRVEAEKRMCEIVFDDLNFV